MNTKPTPDQIFTVYGNMGGDPDQRTIEARTCTKSVYNPVIDGPEERTWTQPEINFLTFSIATGGYDDKPLVWLPCVDWEGLAFRARKGDQVVIHRWRLRRAGPTSTRRTTRRKPSARSSSRICGKTPQDEGPPRGRLIRLGPIPRRLPGPAPRPGAGPTPSGAWEKGGSGGDRAAPGLALREGSRWDPSMKRGD